MSIGLLLLAITLNNFIFVCKSENAAFLTKQLGFLLEPYKNLTSLPINYVLTDEEVQKNLQEYNEGKKNEDILLNGTQLIQKYGYDVEEHHVTTSDGYILAMYRIPCKGTCKGVVFLMHGLLSSFQDWLTIGPDKALPYLLAASGYEVWLGNARGNPYSKKHISLSPSDDEFWDFSWDEIGRYDLPAMIDYVLDTTGEDSLIYIGHSQGTTAFFVLCSELPEYNSKIRLIISLSAVAWMKHVKSPVKALAPFRELIYALASALGLNDAIPNEDLKEAITLTLCGNSVSAALLCQNIVFLIVGIDYPQNDYKQLPVIYNHYPVSSSLKQLVHYAQLIVSGYFRKYDYGPLLNLNKYDTTSPPSYPVEKITAPTAIFYSYEDWFANPIDVEVLKNKMQNVVDYYEVPFKTFNHNDYLFAKDVKSLVYDRVMKLISDYSNAMK